MSVHKIQVTAGQKIVVKTRSAIDAATGRAFTIRQGTLLRVNRSCLEIEFVTFTGVLRFLNERRWFDIKDNGPTQEVIV